MKSSGFACEKRIREWKKGLMDAARNNYVRTVLKPPRGRVKVKITVNQPPQSAPLVRLRVKMSANIAV